MNGSDDDDIQEPPQHLRLTGGSALRDWRIAQLEATVRRILNKDLPEVRHDIAGERNWRMLVTGGVGVASAFITWVVTTWGNRVHIP